VKTPPPIRCRKKGSRPSRIYPLSRPPADTPREEAKAVPAAEDALADPPPEEEVAPVADLPAATLACRSAA
jgi:hypothetical protein